MLPSSCVATPTLAASNPPRALPRDAYGRVEQLGLGLKVSPAACFSFSGSAAPLTLFCVVSRFRRRPGGAGARARCTTPPGSGQRGLQGRRVLGFGADLMGQGRAAPPPLEGDVEGGRRCLAAASGASKDNGVRSLPPRALRRDAYGRVEQSGLGLKVSPAVCFSFSVSAAQLTLFCVVSRLRRRPGGAGAGARWTTAPGSGKRGMDGAMFG